MQIGKLETYIAQKFEGSLGITTIDREDDYFSIGGSSMLLVLMLDAIEKDFKEEIDAKSFMDFPTVRSFSAFIMAHFPNNAFLNRLTQAHKNTPQQNDKVTKTTKTQLSTDSLESLLQKQRDLIRSWSGVSFCDDLIYGNNIHGKERPIYWTFQGGEELSSLLKELGPDYPIYALRSGHLLFHKESAMCDKFAKYYAEQLIKSDLPMENIILGGNCQGAHIAWGMAQQLLSKGINVSLLFLMEADMDKQYDGNVSLIYGHNSEKHNPYLYKKSPELSWETNYNSYTVDILEADHGKFFRAKNVKQLADILKDRVSAADK